MRASQLVLLYSSSSVEQEFHVFQVLLIVPRACRPTSTQMSPLAHLDRDGCNAMRISDTQALIYTLVLILEKMQAHRLLADSVSTIQYPSAY